MTSLAAPLPLVTPTFVARELALRTSGGRAEGDADAQGAVRLGGGA